MLKTLPDWFYRFFIVWYIGGLILVGFDLLPPSWEWANALFIILAGGIGIFYLCFTYSPLKGILYSVFVLILSIWVEYMGTTYGLFFGQYSYTSHFWIQLFDVPLAVGFAWVAVISSTHALTKDLLRGLSTRLSRFLLFPLIGSMLAVLLDLIIDPVAFQLKEYWLWEEPGFYYDIPASNFLGWWILAFLFHFIGSIFFYGKEKASDFQMTWKIRAITLYFLLVLMFCFIGLIGGLYLGAILVLLITGLILGFYFYTKRRSH
ncbi:carotenoid biosynthesis protein [Bacillus sp. DJP31]|uniref:carotenoid biosynthesis protein n=1 Tax=Bacillus sp. DJP31 TaxID=3409789 RepID=UPI003BB7A55E